MEKEFLSIESFIPATQKFRSEIFNLLEKHGISTLSPEEFAMLCLSYEALYKAGSSITTDNICAAERAIIRSHVSTPFPLFLYNTVWRSCLILSHIKIAKPVFEGFTLMRVEFAPLLSEFTSPIATTQMINDYNTVESRFTAFAWQFAHQCKGDEESDYWGKLAMQRQSGTTFALCTEYELDD